MYAQIMLRVTVRSRPDLREELAVRHGAPRVRCKYPEQIPFDRRQVYELRIAMDCPLREIDDEALRTNEGAPRNAANP